MDEYQRKPAQKVQGKRRRERPRLGWEDCVKYWERDGEREGTTLFVDLSPVVTCEMSPGSHLAITGECIPDSLNFHQQLSSVGPGRPDGFEKLHSDRVDSHGLCIWCTA